MSQKKKQKKSQKRPVKPAAKQQTATKKMGRKPPAKSKRVNLFSAGNLTERPKVDSKRDPQLRRIFWLSSAIILILMILIGLGTGFNADDYFQNHYSELLVDYYTTFGKDTAAVYVEKGRMHFYGGFFDTITGLVNSALGYTEMDRAYHNVRHVFNALLGFLCMLFTALLAREIAGWRAAILTLVFMFLSPRFLGHTSMNPKDIPFAAGFAIAMYYLTKSLQGMPRPKWGHLFGLASGIGIALGVRSGGLLLFGYVGLFAGLDFLFKNGWKGLTTKTSLVGRYAAYFLGVGLVGYLLGILFWPAALADPVNYPLYSLREFSKFSIGIKVLFMGERIMSTSLPWYYPIVWMLKTNPFFILVGFFGSFLFIRNLFKRYQPLPVLLAYFAAVFPVAYIIINESYLYDGWRHLLFIFPGVAIVAALFWLELEKRFPPRSAGRYAVYGVLGLLLLESLIFIIRNPRYPYVYFNLIGGGIKGAYGYYETDYWGVSMQRAVDWLEKEGKISKNMQDTVVIGSNFQYNVDRYARNYFDGKVRVKYVRTGDRYDQDWDYGIFGSRHLDGGLLRSDAWPNGRAMGEITANGVPLVAIEDGSEKAIFKAEAATAAGRWEEAIQFYQQETQRYPKNDVAWLGLANAQMNRGRFREAIDAGQRVLQLAPDNVYAYYYIGLAYYQSGNLAEASQYFTEAVAIDPGFFTGYYYLAVIYQAQNNVSLAIQSIRKALEINPNFKAGYLLAADLYEQIGDRQNAQMFRQVAAQL